MSEKVEFTECVVGPWSDYIKTEEQATIPHWEEVDPMVRGVWAMAEEMQAQRVVGGWQPWLNEFVLRKMQAEQRAEEGDQWPVLNSSFRQYFFADGFGGLKYGASHAGRLLASREDYTYVDWFATPAAIRSAAYTTATRLGLGVSVGLSAHGQDKLVPGENIHHISGSALDPNVHAQMLTLLGDRQIDLFTARPKGGMGLLPTMSDPHSIEYYYRLADFIYRRMSPGGLMFLETPQSRESQYEWYRTMEQWVRALQAQGVDADYDGTAMVLQRSDTINRLPRISDDEMMATPSRYFDSSKLRTLGLIAARTIGEQEYAAYLEHEVKRRT